MRIDLLHKMDDDELWAAYRECVENSAMIKGELQKRCGTPTRGKQPRYNKKRRSNANRHFR